MIRCDAIVVGGGPAGSTCAWTLARAGWDVTIVDRARFPRDKVCAGWLTPEVFALLELTPDEYRGGNRTLQEITGFRTGLIGGRLIGTHYTRVVSYAVRRCEFDTFLLRRSGARVLEGIDVASIARENDRWIVNGQIEARVLIGAGGHFCPVARHLRGGNDSVAPVVAREAEFPLSELPEAGSSPAASAPALYFCRDLEGYGWCVRKGDYLNIGLGRRDKRDFNAHLRAFAEWLEASGAIAPGTPVRWHGHAYLASGAGCRPVIADGLILIGDSAGLAYPESGEGIRPAIASGRLAASVLVAADGRVDAASLKPYEDALRQQYPRSRPSPAILRSWLTRAGRHLLNSPTFTRHIVLDRWFLRAHAHA